MKKFFLISSFIAFTYTLLSQEIKNDLSLAPPSPEMATLGSYAGFGVDHYTGRANISIPIYEIKLPDFSLPISLSYNTGGHRVEEIASWVGLGWSLNAGGMISRTVFGLADNQSGGYMDELIRYTAKEILELPNSIYKDNLITDIHDGDFDTQPDIFRFGFAGQSGEFYFNQESRKIVFVPMDNLWIDLDLFLTSGIWHVKDENGVEYFFEKEETNLTFISCEGSASSPDNFESGWYLTRIITPIERTEISFNYTSIFYQVQNPSSHTLNSGNGTNSADCAPPMTKCDSYNEYNGFRLESIEWNDKRIEFEALTERLDLPNTYRLDQINLYETLSSTKYKSWQFDYDYNYSNPESLPSDQLRLKLKSITEKGLNNISKPPYRFEYDDGKLPGRFSYAQDMWGYYNGENNNNHLVPPLQNKDMSLLQLNDGANRNVNPNFSQAEVLKTVIYPTGGSTILEYENHTIASTSAPPFADNDYLVPKGEHLDINDRIGTNELFESDIFEINDVYKGGAYVKIRTAGVDNCEYCPIASSCAVLSLIGVSEPSESFTITCDMDDYFLPNGTYQLKADFTGNVDPTAYSEFIVQMNWVEDKSPLGLTNYEVGGLRIKSITDVASDGIENLTLYDYLKSNSDNSSGKLLRNKGLYERDRSCLTGTDEQPFIERKSTSLLPISSSRSPVVYEEVSEIRFSENSKVKSTFLFSFENDFETEIPIYPGPVEHPPIPVSMEFRRGLLKEQSHLVYVGRNLITQKDSFNVVSKKLIEYTNSDNAIYLDGEIVGDSLNCNSVFGLKTDKPVTNFPGQFAKAVAYKVLSEFIKPKTETTTTYENGKELTTTVNYYYDNPKHRLPTRIISSRSDGLDNIRYVTYPEDIDVPGSSTDFYAAGITSLQNKHVLNQPIEIINKLFNPSNDSEEVLNATMQLFLPASTGNVSVKKAGKNVSHQPITFDTNGELIWDPAYETEIDILRENGTGKVLQTTTKDGVITSYIWGYDKQVIIGVITGVDYQTLTKPPFDLNIHTSYYDVYIEGFMDDWREEFPEAQITSYTYTDDLKITSQTDSNGRKTTYEYDDLRRLKVVRDNENHILRAFDYSYKQN